MESPIAPAFLVAAPHMRDPHFEKTVIFMMEHDDQEGSMGLVINRRSQFDLSVILKETGIGPEVSSISAENVPVLAGGPVSPEMGWVLHSPEWRSLQTKIFDVGIGLTASLDILKAISSGNGPREYLFLLGYAGWGPNQLISEIKTGAWINVPFDRSLVFETPLENKWNEALASLGIDPLNLAPIIGDA